MRNTLAYRPIPRLVLILGFAWCAAALPSARADVRDDAGLFKPETVKNADQIMEQIKKKHGKELVVETFQKPPAGSEVGPEGSAARSKFFKTWAIERAKDLRVNGIYVLISKSPGHVQVEVGNETNAHGDFTENNRDHLSALLLKDFREKKFDEGLLAGTQYVQATLDEQMPAPTGRSNKGKGSAPGVPGTHKAPEKPLGGMGLGGSLMGMVCVGLVVILVIWLVIGLFRSMSRGASGGMGGAPGYGAGGGGMGGGGGYGGGGGGGFMTSLIGGMFGAAAGNWMYDRFFRDQGSMGGGNYGAPDGGYSDSGGNIPEPPDTDYTSSSGGDFGDGGGDQGGGDLGRALSHGGGQALRT